MRYRSKISFLYILMILSPLFVIGLISNFSIKLLIFFSLYCTTFSLIYTYISYEISGKKLIISNLFLKSEYDILKIERVDFQSHYLSGPSFSQKKIKLEFKDKSYLFLSPRQENEFLKYLKELNPSIEIQSRNLN